MGEQWDVGKMDKFMKKYDMMTTSQDGTHGTCRAKAEAQRRAIKMKHPFAVYPVWDSTHPQIGQAEDYLLQYLQGAPDYGPVQADIFERTYQRLDRSEL